MTENIRPDNEKLLEIIESYKPAPFHTSKGMSSYEEYFHFAVHTLPGGVKGSITALVGVMPLGRPVGISGRILAHLSGPIEAEGVVDDRGVAKILGLAPGEYTLTFSRIRPLHVIGVNTVEEALEATRLKVDEN